MERNLTTTGVLDLKSKYSGVERSGIIADFLGVDNYSLTRKAARLQMPRVAGVYMNRLKRGIKLDADPTVKFALNDPSIKRILLRHLKVDSPYNTYLYAGLPPGPITIPSTRGIDAVLGYENHDYLYFCASAKMDGTHKFARTLGEHNRNAREYHAALNRLKIR